MSDTWLILFAVWSGMCFAVGGMMFRTGAGRGIHALHVAGVSAVTGVILFGVGALGNIADHGMSGWVVLLGVVTGLTQYVVVRLIQVALRLGPLAPLWCALMLCFVPVTVYAAFVFDETLQTANYAAIGAALVCVLAGSKAQHQDDTPHAASAPNKRWARYSTVLVFVLLFNSVGNANLKDLATRSMQGAATYMESYLDLYLTTMYGTLVVVIGFDLLRRRLQPSSFRLAILLGVGAGLASAAGMWMLGRCASMPAATAFTLNSVAAILGTAVADALLFRERLGWGWYTAVAAGIASVLLTAIPLFGQ